MKKTAVQTSLGQRVFFCWEADRSRTTQQGTQLKRHRCLQHLMNNQQSKTWIWLYLCSVTQQVVGLKEESLDSHFSQTKLYNHAANSQESGAIKACNCTGAVQDQKDHLFRTFWFHSSPEFTHISTKRKNFVWFSTGLCQVTDGLHALGRCELQVGVFLLQGQDKVSFLEGITAFLFQVLTGSPLFRHCFSINSNLFLSTCPQLSNLVDISWHCWEAWEILSAKARASFLEWTVLKKNSYFATEIHICSFLLRTVSFLHWQSKVKGLREMEGTSSHCIYCQNVSKSSHKPCIFWYIFKG